MAKRKWNGVVKAGAVNSLPRHNRAEAAFIDEMIARGYFVMTRG